jgi:endo-1,4-beta-D-glucanase Y
VSTLFQSVLLILLPRWSLSLAGLLATFASRASELSHPFPQHVVYAAGTLHPTCVTQTQMDAAVAGFYDTWKSRYLHAGCDAGQMYVAYNIDGDADNPNAISVSEGHGYGMVLTALITGYDANAQVEFDALFTFFKAHPSRITPALMGWQQAIGCVAAPGGDDAATDGDFDIAYALLLADAQWGSSKGINYKAEALKVIEGIKKGEINAITPSITLGDWVSDSGHRINATRLSDFMPDHLRAFYRATNDKLWLDLINRLYASVDYLQTKFAPRTGLVPDFAVQMDTTRPKPATSHFLESRFDGSYYYNACRVPWRIGTDYALVGDVRAKAVLDRMNAFIQKNTKSDPAKIHPGYYLTGKPIHTDYAAMAFTAPFTVAAMTKTTPQSWLNALWENVTTRPSDEDDYFGLSIKVQALLVVSGNWWAP